MTIDQIAKVCHEANRAYCEGIGDGSQLPWDRAADWQRESAEKGVSWRLAHPHAPASAQHDAWTEDKVLDGWVYGPVKDADLKQHPCLVPYEELPDFQKAKDALFVGIVRALSTAP